MRFSKKVGLPGISFAAIAFVLFDILSKFLIFFDVYE